MQIDEAWRDDLARGSQHPLCLVRRDLALQGLDDPEADTDVALGPQVLAGVEHLGTFDEEIEFVVGTHRRPSRRARRGRSRYGG